MIDEIPSNVVMYLINAIYLKATWQYQFDKERTEKMDFTLTNGSKILTDMMFSEGVKASIYSDQDLQYIELPYGNGQFVFSILLPEDPKKLDEIINTLEIQQFNSFIDNADTSTVQVYLPKFKIEYKMFQNKDALKERDCVFRCYRWERRCCPSTSYSRRASTASPYFITHHSR